MDLTQRQTYRVQLPLEQVSPALRQGFLAYEDRYFYWHPGVNPAALARAAWVNARGSARLGASTLPMQLARLMQPRPRRLGAKAIEALRALMLSARHGKQRLLEDYLNSVPMGGNIEGVGAAAWLYFGKPASQLSLSEAALLIGLPRSPSLGRPDRYPDKAKARRDQVLDRIAPDLGISAEELAQAKSSPLPRRRFANPSRAPHWVDRWRPSAPPGALMRLTLEPALQARCEALLSGAVEGLKPLGSRQGALLVVDNRSLRILAYVGGPDYHEKVAGQINGAAIARSPGSALKPFLYARALEAGLITPQKTIFDIPRDYGGFRPVNFEGSYLGPVSAQDALAHSLNTPAVWLEAQLNRQGGGLRELMRKRGLYRPGLHPDPGLSAALGGIEITLEDLVALYAGLANHGLARPLRHFDGLGPLPQAERFLDEGAAYLALEMISQVQRPDLPSSWEYSPTHARVAFKTGTSYGYRDAWCVGSTPSYTVGVWLGNADATGSPALRGAKVAAPLVLTLFNELLRSRDEWFQRPPGVQEREVCQASGMPAGPDCPRREKDYYLPGLSPSRLCDVHRRLWLRRSDGKRVDLSCMQGPDAAYRQAVVEIWPPDVTRFMRATGRAAGRLPDPAPDCAAFMSLEAPHIINPSQGGHYELLEGLAPERQQLALSAQCSPDARKLYWFVNELLVAEAEPGEIAFWRPEPGKWKVSVADSEGRSESSEITVTRLKPSSKDPR